MMGFRVAVQFLTRLPVRTETVTARQVASSYYFYPAIGFVIGLAAVILRRALTLIFPDSFSIVIILGFLVWVTGGLHEDGLADVADAAGGWTREERFRIMKDARIGAFGAIILILCVLAKYAALTSMDSARIDAALMTAQILGRWAFLPLGYFTPYANDGLGSEFAKRIRTGTLIVTTLFSGALVILISRVSGAVAFCVAGIVVAVASTYFRRWIGGITGDCFGATFHFVEIATYASFLA